MEEQNNEEYIIRPEPIEENIQEVIPDNEYTYIFEDAITGSLQIIKKLGNVEPVLLAFNKFINVQDVLSFLQNLTLDEKIEYPQFYVIKTKTPQNYIS